MFPLTIDASFCGIPGLAQGGYVSGLIARLIDGPCEVKLRRTVQVGLRVDAVRCEGGVRLESRDAVLAEASPTIVDVEPPPVVPSWQEAEDARRCWRRVDAHPFPNCIGCGPQRKHGEGLRIFPGPVDGRDLVASAWRPDPAFGAGDGTLAVEFVWTALDCPAWWALLFCGPPDRQQRALTGSIAVDIRSPVTIAQRLIVLGWPLGHDDRKVLAGAGIFSVEGEPLALSKQTCVLTESGVPLGPAAWHRKDV